MAASSTVVCGQMVTAPALANTTSNLRCSKLIGAASPSLAAFRTRTSQVVRCEAGNDRAGGLREAVDQATKKTITKDDILRNQETNESEKKSVFGTEPTSGSLYPRPEVERRPETGDKSFTGLFAFDGAAPETINGRLAMVGLVWAFLAEKATGLTVFEQLYTPGQTGLVFFVGAVQLFTYASLVPIMNGESTDARSFGPFTARAERWNGRLAMIGFLSLVVTEMFRHAPVFH
ncbi:hypothetical protein KC19_11G087100 [Ceratodon purpureus]|uniref:Early light-induced protein n=1 Tax=Ceratodon purpureus TaxID=3225 RepID=A0A8T0GGJ1_CERPU|nr:hypothetical protein KC19_11G087100 [Ceratodon purpureus]